MEQKNADLPEIKQISEAAIWKLFPSLLGDEEELLWDVPTRGSLGELKKQVVI